MTFNRLKWIGICLFFTILSIPVILYSLNLPVPLPSRISGKRTVTERLEETRPLFEAELVPKLKELGLTSSPAFVTLAFFKDEKVLHLYAGESENQLKFVKNYPVTAASGKIGPKLRQGDRQVPEGIYRIEFLNPNSAYYLSLRVNYPNEEDRKNAAAEGRKDLGGDIMIHGSYVSIGCIALGDNAISEIFHLAAKTNYRKWQILLAPSDLRVSAPPSEVTKQLPWMEGRYERLKVALSLLPKAGFGAERF